mgnify:CR=1 FL=1
MFDRELNLDTRCWIATEPFQIPIRSYSESGYLLQVPALVRQSYLNKHQAPILVADPLVKVNLPHPPVTIMLQLAL